MVRQDVLSRESGRDRPLNADTDKYFPGLDDDPGFPEINEASEFADDSRLEPSPGEPRRAFVTELEQPKTKPGL